LRTASPRSGGIFDTPAKEARLQDLTRLMESPDFWGNQNKANTLLQEKAAIDRSLKLMIDLTQRLGDLEAMAELAAGPSATNWSGNPPCCALTSTKPKLRRSCRRSTTP
jgi:hypothetical protein